ncbi:hypothetical protein SRHO_G00133580 [Serrasalmus rhombeus]
MLELVCHTVGSCESPPSPTQHPAKEDKRRRYSACECVFPQHRSINKLQSIWKRFAFHGHEGDHALRRIRLDGAQLPRALIGQRFSIESPPPLLCQIRCAFIESAAGRRALLQRSPLCCCTRHREHNFGHMHTGRTALAGVTGGQFERIST